jgi:hypothetical protein
MDEKINIVIPLGKSKTDYLDLRYTLRGIEKFLKNYQDIYIIGEKPKWIQNVIHIEQADNPKKEFKEFNIYNKIIKYCTNSEGVTDFMFMNDDHIFMQEVNAVEYPFYHRGDLTVAMKTNTSNYRATLNHTRKYLRKNGLEETHCDLHCPIIFNKSDFIKTFKDVDWSIGWGYGIKSIYAGMNNKTLVYMSDCKIIKDYDIEEIENKLKDRHIMSCDDGGLKTNLLNYLNCKLNEKSIYEKS